MDAAASATTALQKAQATQIYADLNLWPAAVTAKLVEAQLVEDGLYPGAEGIFAEAPPVRSGTSDAFPASLGSPAYLTEPRNSQGRWTTGEGRGFQAPDNRPILISDPDETKREFEEGVAGGPGPLDNPLPPQGEDPIVQLIPRAASHGPLERVPSPASALSVLPRTPTATAKPIAPVRPTGHPSLSGPSGEAPGLPGPLRTLESIEVPRGLTLKARGETIKQRADYYAEEARKALNLDRAPSTNQKGGNQPDGLREGSVAGFKIALETKYLSSAEKRLRDPSRDISFINQIDLEQAKRYFGEFKGGVLWVTKDKELSEKYKRLFNSNGLSGVRVVYIRSTEE